MSDNKMDHTKIYFGSESYMYGSLRIVSIDRLFYGSVEILVVPRYKFSWSLTCYAQRLLRVSIFIVALYV
jgi:hypothetical protein